MNFELKIQKHPRDIICPAPQQQDIEQAIAQLRRGDADVLDLYRAGADHLMQVVNFGDGIGIAVFQADDAPVLYSGKEYLDDAEILAMCLHYLQGGEAAGAPITFSEVDWADRIATPPALLPALESEAFSVLEGDVDDSPQALLATWMDEGGGNDKEWLDEALAGGATFTVFSAMPPLVYLAQHRGHPDGVASLLAHGADIEAEDKGKTALWHAVSNSNYRFANALLAAGAAEHTASTSPRYARWKELRAEQAGNESDRALASAIRCGDIDRIRALLQHVPRHRLSLGFLEIAIGHSQLEALRLLVQHKGTVSPKKVGQYSLWGSAMAHRDPAYIAALIEAGAYDSVSRLDNYGGTEFLYASPQVLRYLLDNGFTTGLESVFTWLVDRQRGARLLHVFPDHYFTTLAPEQLLRAIKAILPEGPTRVSSILEVTNFGALVRYLFQERTLSEQVDNAQLLIPALFGTEISGPWPYWQRDRENERFGAEVRHELGELALSIWRD